jgi:hypothetical protein
MLKAGGFATAAFNTMGNIAGEIGFSRGFDHYFDLFREPALVAKRHRLNAAKEGLLHTAEAEIALPLAEDINDYLLPWLAERQAQNTFSFVWSIETHEPYGAPEPVSPLWWAVLPARRRRKRRHPQRGPSRPRPAHESV